MIDTRVPRLGPRRPAPDHRRRPGRPSATPSPRRPRHRAQGGRFEESLPLVEAVVGAQGPDSSSRRLVDSVGARLRYLSHDARRDEDWHELTVRLHDPETDLAADVVYRSPDGIPVLRAHVELRNGGSNPLDLESVTSLVLGVLTTDPAQLVTADLLWAENDWMDEHRWQRCPLRHAVPNINGRVHQPYRKGAFTIAGKGSCSSGGHLPMGALSDRGTGRTWLWQLETNGGGWQWECGRTWTRDSCPCPVPPTSGTAGRTVLSRGRVSRPYPWPSPPPRPAASTGRSPRSPDTGGRSAARTPTTSTFPSSSTTT